MNVPILKLPPIQSTPIQSTPIQSKNENASRKQTLDEQGLLRALSVDHNRPDAITIVARLPDGVRDVTVRTKEVGQRRRIIQLSVPELVIQIEGLPTTVTIQTRRAWRYPQKEAQRHYFKVFGAWVHTQGAVRSSQRRIIAHGVTLRTQRAFVRCIPLYKASRAAGCIGRFWRTRRRELKSWSLIADAVIHHTLPPIATPRVLPPSFIASILEHKFDGVTRNLTTPHFVAMFGLPGAGKNHWLMQKGWSDTVVVDVDECLGMLPVFWTTRIERISSIPGEDWVFPIRGEARKIANMIFEHAVQSRTNLVWNGTGRTLADYTKMIKRVRDAGYIVELCGVAVDTQTAKKRMRSRERKIKRPVPIRVLKDAMKCVHTHFGELAEDADVARVWWNASPSSPTIIWDNTHGIVRPDEWARWNNPSPLPITPPL
jgi:predicted ABC-type ATPase